MTDLITAEEIEALKADLRPMNGCDIFDRAYAAIASLHAQLADAQAAQAMWIEELESDLLDRVIEGSVWSMPEGTRATDEWRRGVTDARRDITAAVKLTFLTLAPIDGLAAVEALRAEIADLKMNMDADLRTMVREGQQLRTLAAELAAAQQREARLRAALEYYADTFCEGFCKDLPQAGTYQPEMDLDCSGCKARAALAQTPTDPGDGWTWHERLGWIGPDGKPADPRRRG